MNVRWATLSYSFSDQLHIFKHDIDFDGMNYNIEPKLHIPTHTFTHCHMGYTMKISPVVRTLYRYNWYLLTRKYN